MPVLVTCKQCGKPTIIAAQEASNGAIQMGRWCLACCVWSLDSRGRQWIPHYEFEDIGVYPIVLSLKTGAPCCIVGCTETSIEDHHFAPKEFFGADEAENWPRGWLCVRHHHLWHNTINKAKDENACRRS